MRDLRKFINENATNNAEKIEGQPTVSSNEFAGNYGERESFSTPEQIYDSLQGKSKDELTQRLFAEIARKKQNGTFSITEIENFATQISPMLDATAKSELAKLISSIKSQ